MTVSDPAGAARRRPPPAERRVAAIDAFIDLALEHGEAPRPEDVAARAEVSLASLYRYFENLDELRHDAHARVLDRFPDLFAIPDIGTGTRDQRITSFATSRVALHETLHQLQLLVRSVSRTNPAASEVVDSARASMADQIRLHFDAELRTVPPAERRTIVTSVGVITSVESWEQFRRTDGLTPNQTRRAWANALDRLLP